MLIDAVMSAPDTDDSDDDSGSQLSLDDFVKPADWPEGKPWGTLTIYASCTPADITYPTDLKLLNEARQSTERIIDNLCDQCCDLRKHRPRYARGRARANFLSVAKQKKPRRRRIIAAIRRQLDYLQHNLDAIDSLIASGVSDRIWRKPSGLDDPVVAQAARDQRAVPPAKHPAVLQKPQHARPHCQSGSTTCSTDCPWQGKSCC